MKQNLRQFIAERAEHLAIVHLTRGQNLFVERMTADSGLNFLVSILQEKSSTGRIFGIQTKGIDTGFKNIQDIPLFLSERDKGYFQNIPFPVCLLLFTMDDDRGYYRWLKYTLGEFDHNWYTIEQYQWHFLDKTAIDQIIQDVNHWYEQKSNSVA